MTKIAAAIFFSSPRPKGIEIKVGETPQIASPA
jgi:hypothetical protein